MGRLGKGSGWNSCLRRKLGLVCESQLFSITTVCYCSELAVLVSLERKSNPLPESEKSSCCHRRLLRAFLGFLKCVLLDQFSVSSVKMSYPQVEADLKMQTNMYLRYPGGGTFLRSLPGIAANLSEVIHEPRRKSKSVLKSRAPDWHHP